VKAERVMTGITILLFIAMLWIGVTSTIFRFKHPSATSTETILQIPHYTLLDFSWDEASR
jgi:hypothetical protein